MKRDMSPFCCDGWGGSHIILATEELKTLAERLSGGAVGAKNEHNIR